MMHGFADVKGSVRLEADVAVVGSGAGGAVAAHRLARAGRGVILIEEGSHLTPDQYSTDSWAAMQKLYRDKGMRAMTGNLIIPTMQARVVGGTTVINSAICFRLPDDVLDEWVEQENLEGLSPRTLAPLFSEIETFLNISPEPDDVLGMNNLLMKRGCEALGWKGDPIFRNTRGCKGCGVCMSGCTEGAKMSMDRSYVPGFVEHGGELYSDCRIEKIVTAGGRAAGVSGVFVDPATLKPSDKTLEVKAKAVVISCGAIGTPVHRNPRAPSKKRAGQLLRHGGKKPLQPHGHRHGGLFRRGCVRLARPQPGLVLRPVPFIMEVAWAPPDVIGIRIPGFGARHKDMMADLRHMALWGAMIRARSTGRVKARKKGWSPAISYSMSRRDARLMQVSMKATADLLFAAGAHLVCPGIHKVPSEMTDPAKTSLILDADLGPTEFNPIGNHPSGTCRMSEDKSRGVVNSYGECHDVKNLFIADASIFPDSPGVNPQVTIMALSARVADHINERL